MRRSVMQPFKIDKNARSFELAGQSVQVGARAFDVLAFLDDHADRVVSKQELLVKWSGKFGQCAKMYPTRTNGYENDKTTELFRPV